MQEINVKTNKPYNVIIDKGIAFSERLIISGVKKVLIVTDCNVGNLYLDKISDALNKSQLCEVYTFVMSAGEEYKTEKTVFQIIAELSKNNFTRADQIIAFGGGIVGDTAGFAASIYMRGIRYVQVPTTLLSAIDSSVGGKTAVNVNGIKNVAGTFYQPEAVFIDTDIISKISPKLFIDGMGEGVKYAILSGGRLAELVIKGLVKENFEEFIALCVACKAEVVSTDEFEGGYRRVLNLGHTVAHAIETLSAHAISHGHAVALGIVKITRAAVKLGLIDTRLLEEIEKLIKEYFKDIEYNLNASAAIEIIAKDKKCIDGKVAIVVPMRLGGVEIVEVEPDKLKSALE